ncbi:CBS domain containing protein [Ferroglobus placidus DSM 10642]|uniref:CBS domain containing protein n=1 Tax=Ferroglobus placidus (strain DSM 10642 / AEDII12DO) TaxID=589924 RepID=D3S2S8_FERPA|nr:CBS domain-containing protein [Ferroglobus placidus]ADC66640.1 CBS domain containing protein [Ferroglobus placidus DSM 10642]
MRLKVKDYMTKDVVVVKPDQTIKEVIDLIEKTGHDGFPVIDDNGIVIGYISSRDLLRKNLDTKVKDVMSKKLIVAREHMDLRDAARVMFRTGRSKLPVIDEKGKLIGIISNTDVIRSQIERADPKKVENLRKTIESVHNVKTELKRGKIEVDRIIPTQTKVYADELRGRVYELKKGLAEPVIVIKKGGKYYLVDGHHRVVAAKKIGIDKLDAYIIEVPENVELGLEKLVRKKGIKSVRDIQVLEDATHPLVEITFKNSK